VEGVVSGVKTEPEETLLKGMIIAWNLHAAGNSIKAGAADGHGFPYMD
jgi:hypothetical protein